MKRLFNLLSVITMLFSCSQGPIGITGTETGNGTGGSVAFSDGTPAAGAQVMMVPSYYEELNPPVRDFMIVSTITDSLGHYRFSNLIEGYYSVFSEMDGYKSFIDSVCITDTFAFVKKSVLSRPGTCRGVSYYSSGSMPIGAYLVITGSRFYTRIDEKTGVFNLSGIPAGLYKAKITGPSVDYFRNIFTVAVSESAADSVVAPIRLVSNSVTSLSPAHDGSLWVGTTNGLLRLSDNDWVSYGLHDGLSSSRINCVTQCGDSGLWAGTTFRLAQFTGNKLTKNYDFVDAVETINVKVLRADSHGRVWVGTGSGLFLNDNGTWTAQTGIDPAGGLLVGSSAKNQLNDISAIALHGPDLLVGTHHGLLVRGSTGAWHSVSDLTNMSVNALEVVDSGVFLVGTGNGLFRCNGDRIEKVAIADSGRAGVVTCILTDGGKLFAGTENGLYVHENGVWSAIDLMPLDNYITAIAVDNTNRVWVGTTNGLCRIDENGIEIIR